MLNASLHDPARASRLAGLIATPLLLLAAMAWSLLLGWQRLNSAGLPMQRQLAASACLLLAVGMIGVGWWLQFWGWA